MTLIRSKIWISGISGILAMASLGSCSHSAQWEAKGTVAGGEGREMLLQASTNGRWYTIDTVEIDKNGKFSVTQSPAGYPDIYRQTRYPSYKERLMRSLNNDKCQELLKQTDELRKWIKNKL